MNPSEEHMEAMLKQYKAMGMTDDMIAMFKQQMEASMKFMPQMEQQAMGMAAEMQNAMPEMQKMMEGLANGEIEMIELSPTTKLTPAQKKAVACGADLAFMNDQYLDDLTTGLGEDNCTSLLSSWWGVTSRKEMIETIEDLQKGGHRHQFSKVAQIFAASGAKDTKKKADDEDVVDEPTAVERLQNLRDALKQFIADGLLKKGQKIPDMMVWDFARIINISRAGFDSGYLKREEALKYIETAAKEIYATYGSWKEMSIAYQLARYVWGGDAQYEMMKESMELLLNDERSPWRTISWKE